MKWAKNQGHEDLMLSKNMRDVIILLLWERAWNTHTNQKKTFYKICGGYTWLSTWPEKWLRRHGSGLAYESIASAVYVKMEDTPLMREVLVLECVTDQISKKRGGNQLSTNVHLSLLPICSNNVNRFSLSCCQAFPTSWTISPGPWGPIFS